MSETMTASPPPDAQVHTHGLESSLQALPDTSGAQVVGRGLDDMSGLRAVPPDSKTLHELDEHQYSSTEEDLGEVAVKGAGGGLESAEATNEEALVPQESEDLESDSQESFYTALDEAIKNSSDEDLERRARHLRLELTHAVDDQHPDVKELFHELHVLEQERASRGAEKPPFSPAMLYRLVEKRYFSPEFAQEVIQDAKGEAERLSKKGNLEAAKEQEALAEIMTGVLDRWAKGAAPRQLSDGTIVQPGAPASEAERSANLDMLRRQHGRHDRRRTAQTSRRQFALDDYAGRADMYNENWPDAEYLRRPGDAKPTTSAPDLKPVSQWLAEKGAAENAEEPLVTEPEENTQANSGVVSNPTPNNPSAAASTATPNSSPNTNTGVVSPQTPNNPSNTPNTVVNKPQTNTPTIKPVTQQVNPAEAAAQAAMASEGFEQGQQLGNISAAAESASKSNQPTLELAPNESKEGIPDFAETLSGDDKKLWEQIGRIKGEKPDDQVNKNIEKLSEDFSSRQASIVVSLAEKSAQRREKKGDDTGAALQRDLAHRVATLSQHMTGNSISRAA